MSRYVYRCRCCWILRGVQRVCCIDADSVAAAAGVVDNATVQMMKMPRCGVPDPVTMGGIARRRRKRYTAPGTLVVCV